MRRREGWFSLNAARAGSFPYVVVIVKPFKVEHVLGVLQAFGVDEVQVEDVRGYARQKGHRELYAGSEYDITFLPKARIAFAVDGGDLEQVLARVCEAARTGRIGDGKILVLPGSEAAGA